MNEDLEEKKEGSFLDDLGLYVIIFIGSSFIWLPILFILYDIFSGTWQPSNYCPPQAEDRGYC